MNRQNSINHIATLLSRFTNEVKLLNTLNLYDINIHAENILIPLLNKVFDINLVNANFSQEKNFAAVDLIDEKNRIAFQVTSSSNSDKVKHTLAQFVKHRRHDKFDVLFIYIIGEKQSKYTGKGFQEIVGNNLEFDKEKNIIDNQDLFKMISGFVSFQKITELQGLLDQEFSDPKIDNRRKRLENQEVSLAYEKIFSNLLQVQIPEYVYVADLNVERDQIIKLSWQDTYKLKLNASDRKVIKKAMRYDEIPWFGDWHCSSNKIITFRNLHSRSEILTSYVDKGTIEKIRAIEYWEQGSASLKDFVALLNFTFEELLRPKAIHFVHKESVYRFASTSKIVTSRKITWKNKKAATRTVIFEMLNKEKQVITCFRHYSFKGRFQIFNNKWYLSINPTWSFTSDGYKKSGLSKFYSTGIKRLESNNTIYYAFLFTAYCLNNVINGEDTYPLMSFGQPSFNDVASSYSEPVLEEEITNFYI